MDSTLSDTMPSGKTPSFPARDVEDVEPIASSSARPSVTAKAAKAPRAPYTLMDGIKMVTGVITVVRAVAPLAKMLRFAAPRSALAVFGVARRRGPLAKLAIFGVGLAVGVGAGLVLAPATGFDLRRMLVVGTKKKKGKARDRASSPERKVDPLAETLRDTIETTARVGAPPPDHEHAAVAGTEVATPTRTQDASVGRGYRVG